MPVIDRSQEEREREREREPGGGNDWEKLARRSSTKNSETYTHEVRLVLQCSVTADRTQVDMAVFGFIKYWNVIRNV